MTFIHREEHWFVPIQWNNGGYDVVFLEKYEREEWQGDHEPARGVQKWRVCFIQLIRASNHGAVSKPFKDLLMYLDRQGYDVGDVQLWFVVPHERLATFTPGRDQKSFMKDCVEPAFAGARQGISVTKAQQLAASTSHANSDDIPKRTSFRLALSTMPTTNVDGYSDEDIYYLPTTVDCNVRVASVSYVMANIANEAGTKASILEDLLNIHAE